MTIAAAGIGFFTILKTIIVQILSPVSWSDKPLPELIAEIDRLSHTLDAQKALAAAHQNPTRPIARPDSDVRQTVDRLNLMGLTIDRDGTLLYVNPYTCRVTAWLPDEVIGRNFFDLFIPPADRARLEQEFEDALQRGGFAESREISLLARSGALRQVQVNSFLVHQVGGQVDSFTLIGEDMTNKKRVASALSYSNAQLQDLVDNTSDLIQLITLDGKFIFVNRAWREVLGYGSDEIASLNLRQVLHPDFAEVTLDKLRRIQAGEQMPYVETVFRSKAGKTIFLSGSINCRFDQGRPTAFRCILHDTTSRIRAERAQKLYYSISNWTLNSTSLDDLYHKIHIELGRLIDARNFFIALYDPGKKYINFPYYVDEYFDGHLRFTKRKLGNDRTRPGLTEYAIRADKALFLYEKDIRQLADAQQIDLYGQQQPQVMLTAPLRIDDQITGIIGVKSYDDASSYGPRDLELLEFISGQVALAIARRQDETALNKQTARLNAIFDSSTYMIWSVNRSLQLTSFNKNYIDLIKGQLGVGPTMFGSLHQLGWRIIGEANRRMIEEKYRLAFRGQPQNFELRFETRPNGPDSPATRDTWHEFHLNPILLAGGAIEEVSGIARDVTNRKQAELSLRQSEEKFRGIFENLQDIYIRADRQGRITMVSPSVLKRSGYTPEEVLGQHVTQFFVDKKVIRRALFKLVRTKSLRNFEATLRRKDGTERQFMFNMLLLKDESGTYSVVAALARDITQLKTQADELVKAKDEAERSLKVKERFLANMSHEIRTPMNGVIGMIDLLTDTTLNDEQRDYVRTIKRSSETLLNILNDILDLSKIEAGKMALHESPVALHEVFDKLIALFGQQANAKGNRLSCLLADDLPTYVIADQTRLLQILSNLTSNAIKFTENGAVQVSATLISKRGKFNTIKVAVQDTGIGITPENIGRLFNSFSQLNDSSRKSFGGTGLGLAISKELATLMKGEVGVESEIGKGSTFWFTVELKETAIAPTQPAGEAAEVSMTNFFVSWHPRVLLVDDNSVNRKVAGEILRKSGCLVTTADSGMAAIRDVETSVAGNELFDVIFMDIQMPDMDGVETTRRLREQFGRNLPRIVAMTAYSMREDRERFLSQGLDDYVAKPIRAQNLIQKVNEIVTRSREQAAQSSQGQATTSRKPTVTTPPTLSPDMPIIDPTILAQLRDLGGDELVESIFADFVAEAGDLVQGANDAFAQGDTMTVKNNLHTLKGSAGTIGVSRVAEVARQAEGKLKLNDTHQLAGDLTALTQAFAEFMAYYPPVAPGG